MQNGAPAQLFTTCCILLPVSRDSLIIVLIGRMDPNDGFHEKTAAAVVLVPTYRRFQVRGVPAIVPVKSFGADGNNYDSMRSGNVRNSAGSRYNASISDY